MAKYDIEPMKLVPVGIELVSGRRKMVAILDTHAAYTTDIYQMAELMAGFYLSPARLPLEEGWDSVEDLPKPIWLQLQVLILERLKARLL